MNTKKSLIAALLAVALCGAFFETASAGCGLNPLCHAAKIFVGDPLTAALPDIEAKVKISHKLENVDELRDLVRATSRNIESVVQVTGGETRHTIEKASDELTAYTAFLDSLAGRRIADLDTRVQAKLLWIQQYTEELNRHVLEIIQVTSQEVQTITRIASGEIQSIVQTTGDETQRVVEISGQVAQETIGVTGRELQSVIGAGGRVMENTVRLAGEELRFSVLTAGGEIKEIVATISAEAQTTIQTAVAEIDAIIESTLLGIEGVASTAESSSLRVLEGSLVIVERGADLGLAVGAGAGGMLFMFIAAYGWGKAVIQHKMPESGATRVFVIVLMVLTFLAALLPFGFLSSEVRAYALLPMDRTTAYAGIVGEYGERLPAKPQVERFHPDVILINPGDTPTAAILQVVGFNLLSQGYPRVTYGEHELPVFGTNKLLTVDLTTVIQNPEAANTIEFQFGKSEFDNQRVEVVINHQATATPLPTATLEPTATLAVARFLVEQNANLRAGPGTMHRVIGTASAGQVFDIIAASPERQWWLVCCINGQQAWVFGQLGQSSNANEAPTAQNIPTPPAAPTAEPTATAIATPTACVEPVTACFGASSSEIRIGEEVVLSWCPVLNADGVAIVENNAPVGVDFGGELKRSPQESTTYELIAGFCSGQTKSLGQIHVHVVTPAGLASPTISTSALMPAPTEIHFAPLSLFARWNSAELLADGHNGVNVTELYWADDQNEVLGYVGTRMAILEDGSIENVLAMFPRQAPKGTIKGWFQNERIRVPSTAFFEAQIGFIYDADRTDGVTFWVWEHHTENGREVWNPLVRVAKSYDGYLQTVRADLSHLAGQEIYIELRVDAGESPTHDWAIWVDPRVILFDRSS